MFHLVACVRNWWRYDVWTPCVHTWVWRTLGSSDGTLRLTDCYYACTTCGAQADFLRDSGEWDWRQGLRECGEAALIVFPSLVCVNMVLWHGIYVVTGHVSDPRIVCGSGLAMFVSMLLRVMLVGR